MPDATLQTSVGEERAAFWNCTRPRNGSTSSFPLFCCTHPHARTHSHTHTPFSHLCLQLAPWLAAEIPFLIREGLVKHKEDVVAPAEEKK